MALHLSFFYILPLETYGIALLGKMTGFKDAHSRMILLRQLKEVNEGK